MVLVILLCELRNIGMCWCSWLGWMLRMCLWLVVVVLLVCLISRFIGLVLYIRCSLLVLVGFLWFYG